MSREDKELYEFGKFRLDVGERRLERLDGSPTGSLPEKSFRTLVHLVRNAGALVTKDELLSVVWPETVVEENNLGKAVHIIRHCLGEKTGEQRYIQTVPKHGYRFVAEVRKNDDVKVPPAAKSGAGILGIRSADSGTARGSRFRNAFEAVQFARIRYCQMTAPTTVEARELISEALWLDPAFAPAYSLSAELTTLEVIIGIKQPEAGFAEARAAIRRARELGAEAEDFYAAAGYVDLIADWDFASAEKNLHRSLAINPHYGPCNRMLGETYMFQGRHEEASSYINRAQVDEVTGIHNLNILAISHFLARRYPAVVEVCDRMLSLAPRHIVPAWTKCWALEQMGRVDEAIAGYERILRLPHGEPALRWIGYTYAIAGDRDRAIQTAERLEAAGREHSLSPTHAAAIYGALGEPERAASLLDAAVKIRDPFMLWVPTDPRFDNLRGDSRFEEIVRYVLQKGVRRPDEIDTSTSEATKTGPRPIPKLQITPSGQHGVVDLSDWRSLIEGLDVIKVPAIPVGGADRSAPEIGSREVAEEIDAEPSRPDSTRRVPQWPKRQVAAAAFMLLAAVAAAAYLLLFRG